MNAPETRERELAPLRKIPDNYEKIVIAMDCDLPQNQGAIKIIGAVDFLLGEYYKKADRHETCQLSSFIHFSYRM